MDGGSEAEGAQLQEDRRSAPRLRADFYCVQVRGSSRYFRLVRNVSRCGLLFESWIADEQPGQVVELELPRVGQSHPLRVKAEIVYIGPGGRVGVRLLEATEPAHLGGRVVF